MRRSALLSFAAAAALFLASCTSEGDAARSPVSSPSGVWRGGTLRIADTLGPKWLDPQKVYGIDAWEILRCCLVRTLLSYNGRPTAEGGATLRPDLAAEMPEVSPDGLTWTFRLRPGLHYAPPFDDVEIVAADIVRALRREADPRVTPEGAACESARLCGYPFYYSVIRGFDAVRAGKASTISGLEVPDDHTLVVRLTKPTGDLGNRLAMPAAAPISKGAADGHDGDYGPFLVPRAHT